MADLKLTRPAAGQNVVVPSAPDARMVLDFAADQVSIDRPQGSDSLFFRFDDGSSIELQNFYTQYNKEAIPSFEVDGQLIAGADFFNAFGPDLAPAAGPAAGPTRAGGYTDYTNANLADGLNSLGGLDLQLNGGAAGDGALLATATATAVAGAAATPDTTPPQVAITLVMTTANGDKVLNIAEAASESSVTLSGIVTVSADTASIPSTVELMLGNISLGNATLTLNADGTYSYTLEVAGAMFKDAPVQQVTTSITVADAAGNTATAQAQDNFTQDTDAPTANITINVIAGDDVMNKAESEQSTTSINGTVTGDVKVGDTVTLTVNGHEYTTSVVDLGNGVLGYQTSVSSADLLNDHNIDAKVVTYDEAGNPGVGTATREIGVDITPPEAGITIGVIAGDDVLNIVESAKETTLVGGQVSGDVKVGDTVTLSVNGHTYTTTVVSTNGVLGYQTQVATSDLSADHSIDAKVVTTDPAGNSTEATASRTIDVDTTPPTAGITVGVVAGDDVINIVESTHLRTLVGGTVSGDVKAGDTVTLTINGHTYTTTVVNNNGVLGYETNVRTFDLWADRSIDAKVVTYDPAGNPTEATASRTVSFDLTPPAAAITIGVIAGDDVINIAENAQAKTLVGGTVGGDVKVGDTITLLINGHEYTTTAVNTNGVLGYQVQVNTYDLRGDHEVDALVITRDAAGNLGFATASRTVNFDTHAPHADITIGVIAGDDMINIVENAQTKTTVGGTVGEDVKLGDTVTLTVNGHTYTTSVVNIGGNKLGYSTQVDTADLRADHSIEAKVVTYDAAGNPGSDTATRTVNFDTTPPTAAITIGVIAGDDVLNISENAQTKTTVGGTVGADVKLGDTVTLTVNGHTYNTTVVNIGGNKLGYSTQVNTADLRADQSIDAKVVTYDAAGNPASATASRDVSFDTTAPTAAITIGVIAGDDVLNIAENNQSKTTVGGTVGGDVKAGDTVTLTVNGHAYTATVVNSGGTLGYSTQVNTSDLRADHSIDAKVVTYDAAGNPGSATASRAVNFDTCAPHANITIGVIAGDDVINIAENAEAKTLVGGTVGEDVKLGDTVTLTVNGHTYTTSVVNIGGNKLGYSAEVNTADLRADHSIEARVVTYDAAGNPGSDTATRTVNFDTTAPNAAITIGVIAGDDVINISENAQTKTTVNGTVGGDAKLGDTVTLTVNGHTYNTSVVNIGGNKLGYSTKVDTADLQADHSIDAKVVTYDAAGNPGSATASRAVNFDTTAPTATITIGVIAGDDVINIAESNQPKTTVGGTVGGDVKAGDTVTLTVNNHTYNATVVNAGGTLRYSTDVNTSDLRADHSIDAKVVTYDAAGNPGSATASRTVNVDTTPPAAAITIGVIAGDDVINIAESHQPTTTVSGTVGGDVKAGDTVVLSVNHHTYTALVVNTGGTLTYSTQVNTFDLRADTSIDAIVTTYDAAGNPATAATSRTIKLDATAPTPAITIGVIADDDVINIAESNQPTTTVGGTVGGDAKAGDTVTLTVNNHTYNATVVNVGGTLRYSTDVNTSDIQADHSIDAKVVTYDAAGNPGSATATRSVNFDTTAPTAAITIGVIAGDDVLNITENAQTKTTVGGTVGGDAKAGDTVTLTVNNHTYNATVVNAGGTLRYSTDVNTSDLQADPSIDAKVVTYDAAGNPGSATATRTVSFDTTAPTAAITIGVIAGDDVLNITEDAQATTTVGGTVGGDAKAGDTVTLTVNGQTYTTSVVNVGGTRSYSTQVNTSDLRADNSIDAKVETFDAAGNPGSATATRTVSFDTTAPTAAITIGVIAGDDVLNITEDAQATTTVGGTVGGDAKAGDTVTLTVNGQTYTTSVVNVGGTLSYSTQVNTSDLRADNSIDAKVETFDAAGNPGSATATRTVSFDTTAPTAAITIGVIAGDDVLNITEDAQATTTVGGTVGGDAKAGDTVTLTVNGQTYTTSVVNVGGTLSYSTQVNTSDLRADHSIDAKVETFDAAGNPGSATATRTVSFDTTAPTAAITIGVIAGDDMLNSTEMTQTNTTVGGTVTGDVKVGDTVTLTVNNHTYTATVSLVNGAYVYQTNVPTVDLVADHSIDARIVVSDAAGNTAEASASRSVTVNNDPSAVTDTNSIYQGDSVAHGNVLINDSDADGNHLTVIGAGPGTSTGTTVGSSGVTINGTYGSITINADGSYTYNLNNSNAAVHNLDGTTLTDKFTYLVSDGHGGTDTAMLNITIGDSQCPRGTNNADVLTGGSGNDVVVGDGGGVTVSAGVSYNMALIIDTSGSMENSIASAKAALENLANQLAAHGDTDAVVNVNLIDFAADSNSLWSGSLTTATLSGLISAIESMYSNGATNYEAGFNMAASWFASLSGNGAQNVVYFVTDGQPTYYYVDSISYEATVDTDKSADLVAGMTTSFSKSFYSADLTYNADGTITDDSGSLSFRFSGGVLQYRINSGSWKNTGELTWTHDVTCNVPSGYTNGTTVYYDANGNVLTSATGAVYRIYNSEFQVLDGTSWTNQQSIVDGYGNYTSATETAQSQAAYALLLSAIGSNGKVNAIGIGSGTSSNALSLYDNTGGAQIITSASELTAALQGGSSSNSPVSADTLSGGAGNDTIFGDVVNANALLPSNTSGTNAWATGLAAGDGLAIVTAYLQNSLGHAPTGDEIAQYIQAHAFGLAPAGDTRGANDTLNGGSGNDMLFGQGGNDTMNGGDGHDVLVGGTGADTLTGGTGADIFLFHPGDGHDIITDFNRAEGDIIVKVGASNASTDYIHDSNGAILDSTANTYVVTDVKQGHSVDVHTDTNAHMLVGAGVDGSHTAHGGDTYDNVLLGGSGNDVIYGGAGNNYLDGGAGNDHIIGGSGDSYLYGGDGNDNLYGGSGNDHLYGGAGNDKLDGGAGHDFLDGGTGTNTLLGGAGNDIMVHHTGDTISGGQGIDVMLTGDSTSNLNTLLTSAPDVEVAIKGTSANPNAPLSLTDISKLADVGININDTASGAVMSLAADKWTDTGDHHTFTNASANLTLTTNLTDSHDSGSSAEVAKFILNNS